ncbi:MAG: hypothetical protein PWQ20_1418 [Thermotogaceae bacterium]|nr:hypothetical protein [Thermotogaceae bacterium]
MRLLYISQFYYPHERGGAEISLRILAENMAHSHKVFVFTIDKHDSEDTISDVFVIRRYIPHLSETLFNLPAKQSKIASLKIRLSMVLASYHKKLIEELERIINEYNPDIVHLNNVVGFPLNKIYTLLKKRNIKIVQSIRDNFLLGITSTGRKIPIWHAYIARVVSRSDVVHFPSGTMMKKFGEDISTRKIVIPNTVGKDFNEREWMNLVNRKKDEENLLRIIYVGTFSKHKGVHLLSEWYSKAYETFHGRIYMTLVGDGPLRSYLEESLKDFIEKGNVQITGWLPHEKVECLMKDHHIVILPSLCQETFGRVLVEGFYNGCLPIGSHWGGIPEVIGDRSLIFEDYNGFLSILNKYFYNKDAWFEKMMDLKEHMLEFSLTSHIKKFENLYEDLLRGG